jgi:hypothetical protein
VIDRYGGIYETESREYTLDDFYTLNLDKRDGFVTLRASGIDEEEWKGSDDEDGDPDEEDEDDEESSSEDEDDNDVEELIDAAEEASEGDDHTTMTLAEKV